MSKIIQPAKRMFEKKHKKDTKLKQECIPVGCVPPAAVAVPGVSPPGTPHRSRHPLEHPTLEQEPPGADTPRSTPPHTRHPSPDQAPFPRPGTPGPGTLPL